MDGISVAVNSAKGKISVSESDTWLAKMYDHVLKIAFHIR
jgi:hypothetical protein